MADSVQLSGPVTVRSDSRERVAFDLMVHIDNWSSTTAPSKDQKYWLDLYNKCYQATLGRSPEDILKR